ncbi:disulfide bond formation protein C [Paenibacillus baekrokdamisoli]|uniref:Disulfide bond formation protein C n=1 Tax=Paenibacillus baekrokdamisoli TaxID=1712516 RepID=A0A3G9IQV8_9BACL|nr:disulfide oxidoreductase [Paenibacillus baekrokdamisoli]MBB3069880.1 disulfide bond formation protein DsbB [Paenibacillus baekrokdamisoli]BBH20766.1 disulfide bond formation protein C [Paenibacillus baekrokdamisoli]
MTKEFQVSDEVTDESQWIEEPQGFIPFIRKYALYLAWIVAIVAVGGSLYLSDVIGFIPCKLCWFQRIFMYPIVIILGIASYKNDRKQIGYVLPLSIIGGLISMYHYAEQKIPALAKALPCTQGIPCNKDYLDWFGGVVTIPFMALIAFILITILLWIGRKSQ